MPEPLPAISLVAVPGRRRQTLGHRARGRAARLCRHLYAEPVRATWRNAPGSPWPPSRSGSAPRSRRSMPRRPRNSRRMPPISTRFRAGGSVLASASRTGRCTSASASRRESRSPTPALLSRSCAPLTGSARCRRSCSPRCASGWWRSPARSPRASCSPMPACRTWRSSLAVLPAAKRADPDFLIGNMLPVCITDDEGAALALHRRRLVRYALLPNYRNYWKEAGYGEEMAAIENAIADGRRRRHPGLPDRPLDRRQHALRLGDKGAATGSPPGTMPASTRRSSSRTRSTATSSPRSTSSSPPLPH